MSCEHFSSCITRAGRDYCRIIPDTCSTVDCHLLLHIWMMISRLSCCCLSCLIIALMLVFQQALGGCWAKVSASKSSFLVQHLFVVPVDHERVVLLGYREIFCPPGQKWCVWVTNKKPLEVGPLPLQKAIPRRLNGSPATLLAHFHTYGLQSKILRHRRNCSDPAEGIQQLLGPYCFL